jgi:hypothetical protein
MNQAGNQLTSFDIKWKPFKSDDLIFLDFSPDYCNINRKSGSIFLQIKHLLLFIFFSNQALSELKEEFVTEHQ